MCLSCSIHVFTRSFTLYVYIQVEFKNGQVESQVPLERVGLMSISQTPSAALLTASYDLDGGYEGVYEVEGEEGTHYTHSIRSTRSRSITNSGANKGDFDVDYEYMRDSMDGRSYDVGDDVCDIHSTSGESMPDAKDSRDSHDRSPKSHRKMRSFASHSDTDPTHAHTHANPLSTLRSSRNSKLMHAPPVSPLACHIPTPYINKISDIRVLFTYSPLGLSLASTQSIRGFPVVAVCRIVRDGQANKLGVIVNDILIGIENHWIVNFDMAMLTLKEAVYPLTLVFRRQESISAT